MSKIDIKQNKRRVLSTDLKTLYSNKHDYIEITEWTNGDGVTVEVQEASINESFNISYDAFDVLKKLIKEIRK